MAGLYTCPLCNGSGCESEYTFLKKYLCYLENLEESYKLAVKHKNLVSAAELKLSPEEIEALKEEYS